MLGGQRGTHVVDNLAEGLQLGHLTSVDFGEGGLALAHGRENLDALDGVDAEVGLEVHLHAEHVCGVASLFSDDVQHQLGEVDGGASLVSPSFWSRRDEAGRSLLGRQACGHRIDDVAEGAQTAHLAGVDLGKLRRLLADRRQNLDALDGVDAEVGFEVHLEGQHVFGVAGLLGDHGQHDDAEVRR